MGFRDYASSINRFLTRDMYNGALNDMGLTTSPWTGNRYAFTGGNPINLVEIDGHRVCESDCSGGEAWQDPYSREIRQSDPYPFGKPTGSGKKTPQQTTTPPPAQIECGPECEPTVSCGFLVLSFAQLWSLLPDTEVGKVDCGGADRSEFEGGGGDIGGFEDGGGDFGGFDGNDADDSGNTEGKTCSFDGNTTVLMADGTRKPIEDIDVGDKVIATDPETGEQVSKKVTRVWVHDDTVIDLEIDGEVITTTEDHPFWSVTDQRFERADQVHPGEKVLGADGRVITVSGLQLGTDRQALAYNLAVEGIHTYHVGDAQILVHNECSDAAYQGMLHIRDEIARDPRGSHSWAANMTDDELVGYLDGFVTRGGGQRLDDGSLGWYDPDRGIAIIQRSEYSMTGYSMPYSDFLGRLAN